MKIQILIKHVRIHESHLLYSLTKKNVFIQIAQSNWSKESTRASETFNPAK